MTVQCMPASSNANQVEMSRWREYEYADIGLPSEYIRTHGHIIRVRVCDCRLVRDVIHQ